MPCCSLVCVCVCLILGIYGCTHCDNVYSCTYQSISSMYVCMYVCIYLSIYLSVYLSVYLSTPCVIQLYIQIYSFVYLSIDRSIDGSILFACVCLCVSVCVCVCWWTTSWQGISVTWKVNREALVGNSAPRMYSLQNVFWHVSSSECVLAIWVALCKT